MSGTFPIRRIVPPTKRSRFGKFGEAPKTIRPVKDEILRTKSIEPEKWVTQRRRGITYNKDFQANLEQRAVPDSVVKGSVHERILYRTLDRKRINFTFQPAVEGGRQELGGLVADFIINDMGGTRGLVIQVQGGIWHTGVFAERRDELNAGRLIDMGYEVVFLWDNIIEDYNLYEEWVRRMIDFAPIRSGESNVAARPQF